MYFSICKCEKNVLLLFVVAVAVVVVLLLLLLLLMTVADNFCQLLLNALVQKFLCEVFAIVYRNSNTMSSNLWYFDRI